MKRSALLALAAAGGVLVDAGNTLIIAGDRLIRTATDALPPEHPAEQTNGSIDIALAA